MILYQYGWALEFPYSNVIYNLFIDLFISNSHDPSMYTWIMDLHCLLLKPGGLNSISSLRKRSKNKIQQPNNYKKSVFKRVWKIPKTLWAPFELTLDKVYIYGPCMLILSVELTEPIIHSSFNNSSGMDKSGCWNYWRATISLKLPCSC